MDYSKGTNFTAKRDTTADPAVFDTEFTSVQVASATKTDKIASPTNNNVVTQDAAGNIKDSGKAIPSGAVVGTTDAQTLTNKTLTSPTIDLSTVSSAGDLAVTDGGTGSSTESGARSNLGLGALAVLNSVAAGQIDANAIGASELAPSAVAATNLGGSTTGSKSLAASATYILPKGIYWLSGNNATFGNSVQVYVNGSWGPAGVTLSGNRVHVWSDGVNVRLNNITGSTYTTYWTSLA